MGPSELSFQEAASVIQGSITAIHALRDLGKVQKGHKVLINGASGGVGVFTVQIAKRYGAEVTGICSSRNVALVRSLGADHVLDYTLEDFTQMEKSFDLIVDNVGNRSLSEYKKVLSNGGHYILVGFSFPLMIRIMLKGQKASDSQDPKMSVLMPRENHKDLSDIKELLESGDLIAVIDRTYPLHELAEAIKYLEKGHASGKVVITM